MLKDQDVVGITNSAIIDYWFDNKKKCPLPYQRRFNRKGQFSREHFRAATWGMFVNAYQRSGQSPIKVTSPLKREDGYAVTADEFNAAFAGLLSRVYRLNVKGTPGNHAQSLPFDICLADTKEMAKAYRTSIN
jgi:hypothetical protein